MKRLALATGLSLVLGLGLMLSLLWLLGNFDTAWRTAYAVELHVCPSACPYASVQAAVDAASAGDIVKVAAGTYTGVSARAGVTQVVYLSKTITIQGGYTTTHWTTAYPLTQPTTLDAQGQGRVLYITGDISPAIEGLRITGGDAAGLGGPSGDSGGGVFVMSATMIMSHNQMFSNVATFGGALFVFNSVDVALIGNTVRGNTGQTYAGGLYFRNNPGATLIANVISDNVAYHLGTGMKHYGGVLFDNSPNAIMIDNIVTANHAADACGGVCFTSSNNAVLIGNTITDNHSGSPGFGQNAGGGGLHFVSSKGANLLDNTVTHNSTFGNGGGLYLERSNITLTNNVIADNRLIAWENFTSTGSALYVAGSSLQLLHTTIARNSGGDGNGIYVADVFGSFSSMAMTNTILVSHTLGITVASGNTATLEATLWGSGAWANKVDTEGAGVIITGAINITGDPAFVEPDAMNYHIRPNSAARDMGITTTVSHDIDGDPRPMGHGYDLGADELRIAYLPLVVKNYDPQLIEVSGLLHAGDVCVMCCYPTSLETADKIYELTLIGWSQYDGYYVKVRGILQNPCGLSLWPLISVISIEVLGPPP